MLIFYHFPFVRYIEEEDLLKFMIKEEVDLVLPLFEVDETGQIDRKALTSWVVRPCIYYLSSFILVSSPQTTRTH